MATKPGPSHFIHSGFVDLASLIATTPSRLVPSSRLWANPASGYNPIPSSTAAPVSVLDRMESGEKRGKENMDPRKQRGAVAARGGRAGGAGRGGRAGGNAIKAGELRRRKVDKRMIGPPTDFRWAAVARIV
jgi:hypothetical protein